MAGKKAAGSVKAQSLVQQDDDGQQGDTITDPATLAQPTAIADRPPKTDSEAGPSKRRCRPQVNDPGSATKRGEATQWELDIEERVRKAVKENNEQPMPHPQATPTRSPPPDHYSPGSKWLGIDPQALSWEATCLDRDMFQWTYNYIDNDPDETEAKMTAKDKQAIIDYLGDWCLYNDWDSLVASFSPLAYLDRFHLLLTATVLKNVFESVVRNPFFYIDLGESWDGSGSDLPPPYGIELNKLFQKGLKVSAAGAHHWRASTIRLLNRYKPYTDYDTPLNAKDITPGTRAYNLRERCIDQFTSNILDDSSLISPILSPRKLSQDQTRSRYRGIRKCYKNASEMAVRFSLQKAGFQFDENANQVAPYQMPIRNPYSINRWDASTFNAPGVYNEFLEGRRVVMILWPATWMIDWKVSLEVKKSWEEIDAKYPPDYDRRYRDENGVHHAVISSGVVIVEKDGREPPLEE